MTSDSIHLVKPPFLGGLTSQNFLDNYWQKQSLFIPNAFPEQINCLEPNDLAGFSLEENIESRIIIERENNQWDQLHGPFNDDTFKSLPTSKWTLLVQAVDHYLPNLALLLDQFNFLPQWRIDDIMMSYATKGGNVGPHYDYYDVFLIQISGQRHWQVGQLCDDKSKLIKNLPIRILKDFNTSEEHIVNPGDVLYLPPGIAHHGIALDDECITLSVGFRAPSYADMLSEYSHHLADQLPGQHRYQDKSLKARTESTHHSGMITEQDVQSVKAQLLEHFSSDQNLKLWMAEFLSLPKYEECAPLSCELSKAEFLELLSSGLPIHRDESSRFVVTQDMDRVRLYINGSEATLHEAEPTFVQLIASRRVFATNDLNELMANENNLSLLFEMVKKGYFYIPHNDE